MTLDVQDCLTIAINPALSLLPPKMDSTPARAMLIATALQESELEHRRQRGGPARSYWQFELGTPASRGGVTGVFLHHATSALIHSIAVRLDYEPTPRTVYDAIEDNDCLGAVCARLLLWTVSDPLPLVGESARAWIQYSEKSWNPGKPHPEKWPANFARGWEAVR